MSFRASRASAKTWSEAVDRLVAGLGDSPYPNGPGFLYLTDHFVRQAPVILERLRRSTGISHWVGASAVGVLSNGVEYREEPAMVALLADWPEGEYRIFSGRSRPPSRGARSSSGREAAHVAIVHADSRTAEVGELLTDMAQKVDSGFLVGGLASGSMLIADDVLEGGLSGLVLSDAIPLVTGLAQGCAPLRAGEQSRHRVTRAVGNVVLELDSRPALDVLREDVGETCKDWAQVGRRVLVGLPVPHSDNGDYVVRHFVGFDPDANVFAMSEEVERDTDLFFCVRDGQSALMDLQRMLDRVTEGLQSPPRGALYVSCLARGEHMFRERSREAAIVTERLGNVPLVGFFAAGEIAGDRLYGYTGVLTVFL